MAEDVLGRLEALRRIALKPMPGATVDDVLAWHNGEKSVWLEKFYAWAAEVRTAEKEIVNSFPALLACARALENLAPVIGKIDAAYIGESMHAGLRKGTEADDAHMLWKVSDSRTSAWGDAAEFTADCIDFHFGDEVRAAAEALKMLGEG